MNLSGGPSARNGAVSAYDEAGNRWFVFGGTSNNGNTSDTYPNVIDGLVYASGDLVTNNSPKVHTVVAVGTWTATGAYECSNDSRYTSNPPPGFADSGTIYPVPGTWRREPAP